MTELFEQARRRGRVGRRHLAGEAHRDRQRHEVLLGPVVEVALDLAPLGVRHPALRRPSTPTRLLGPALELAQRLLQRRVGLQVVQREADLPEPFRPARRRRPRRSGRRRRVASTTRSPSRLSPPWVTDAERTMASSRPTSRRAATPPATRARRPGPGDDPRLLGAQVEVGRSRVRARTRRSSRPDAPVHLGRPQREAATGRLGQLEQQARRTGWRG